MKIVHLLLTHRFAGSERYAIELANEQSQRHEVTMILSRRGAGQRPDALAHRLDPRVRVVAVAGWRPLGILAAHRAVRRLAPDVAHAHLQDGDKALRGPAVPYLRVSTLHRNYEARHQRHLDALIAITPWQLAGIPAHQHLGTRQISNWTRTSPFDPQARRRIRLALGLGDSDFLIGALGRTVYSKGLDVLIKAFSRAAPPDTRLCIVGDGPQWQQLRKQAPASVIMPGFTDRPHDWLCAFDALVSAAREEPVGLVFLEAMAAGLPILATASRSARQLATLIDRPLALPDSTADLAQALRQLASQRPQRRVYDLSHCQLPQQAQQIEDFYHQQLAQLQTHDR